jgi:preprotein translocase subunit SecF
MGRGKSLHSMRAVGILAKIQQRSFYMNKNTGLIATIATALLCGCPGLFICLFGAITAAGQGTFNDQSLSPTVGFVLVCLSLIFIAIPIVVGVVTLRKQPETAQPGEPLPPAS